MDCAAVGVSHSGSLYKTQPLENTTIFPLVLKGNKFNVTRDVNWHFWKLAALAFTKITLQFNRQNFASHQSKQYLTTICQWFSNRYSHSRTCKKNLWNETLYRYSILEWKSMYICNLYLGFYYSSYYFRPPEVSCWQWQKFPSPTIEPGCNFP